MNIDKEQLETIAKRYGIKVEYTEKGKGGIRPKLNAYDFMNETHLQRAIDYFTTTKTYLAEMNFEGLVYHDLVIDLLKEKLEEITWIEKYEL